MTNFTSICTAMFTASVGLALPQNALAQAPNIQTKGAIIHLADNLNEEAMLGWCIDTQGRGLGELLHAHSCKPNGDDVLFSYEETSSWIESVTYEGRCMAYNAPDNAATPFGLVTCDETDPVQKFAYDAASMELHLASQPSQCVTVAATIDNAGPYQSRHLLAAPCADLTSEFKQWVVKEAAE